LEARIVPSGGNPVQQQLDPLANSGGGNIAAMADPAAASGTGGSQASGSGGASQVNNAALANVMLLNLKIYLLNINLMSYKSEINALNSVWTQLTGEPPPTTTLGALETPSATSLGVQGGPSAEQQQHLLNINGFLYLFDPSTGLTVPVFTIYDGLYSYFTQQYIMQYVEIVEDVPPAQEPTLTPEQFAATGDGETFAAACPAIVGE
jgi:hypothetical protein